MPFFVLERPYSVLECPFAVLEHPCFVFCSFCESDFVLGCPGTEEFVSGFLLLPLFQDRGTTGQGIIFVPGQRDTRKSCPELSQDVLSLGNPSTDP